MKTKKSDSFLRTTIFVVLAISFLAACAGPVHFKRTVRAADTFESYHVLPDHRYFYYGRLHAPVAVIAVKGGYRFNGPKWTPVGMTTADLRALVERMRNQPGAEYNVDPNGALILDDTGETIGMWYSVWALPALEFISETEFRLSDPVTRFPITNRNPNGDEPRIID
jgi:hypothetical protein